MALMVFGAMIFWLPMLADPYMTSRLLLVALGAAGLLMTKSERASSMEVPSLLMAAVAIISAVFAADWRYAIIGSYQSGMDSLIAFVCYSCVVFAAARSGETVDDVARMVSVASIPVSLYGIFQRFFHDPLIWSDLHYGLRISSSQGGPIFLGAVMSLSILCSIHLAKKGDKLAWAALAVGLPCLWFTQTRGAMLATAAGAAIMSRWTMFAFIPALVMMPRMLASGTSDIARFEVWKIALKVFADNPLLGYGPGNFYLAFRRYAGLGMVGAAKTAAYAQAHAHNDILHVAATMGLIGLTAYALLGCSALWIAWKHAERRFLFALLAAYAVLSSFNPVTASAFVVLALIFGVASSRKIGAPERCLPLALASVAVFLAVGRLTLADYHYARGGLAKSDPATSAMEFQRAAKLNPWEMFYSCKQVDSLVRLIPYMPLEQRRPLALAARQLAAKAVERHPLDSYAHELLGKQILIGYIAGFRDIAPAKALDEFNKAQEYAPTFETLMWRRLATAKELGASAQAWLADKDISELHRASGKGGV